MDDLLNTFEKAITEELLGLGFYPDAEKGMNYRQGGRDKVFFLYSEKVNYIFVMNYKRGAKGYTFCLHMYSKSAVLAMRSMSDLLKEYIPRSYLEREPDFGASVSVNFYPVLTELLGSAGAGALPSFADRHGGARDWQKGVRIIIDECISKIMRETESDKDVFGYIDMLNWVPRNALVCAAQLVAYSKGFVVSKEIVAKKINKRKEFIVRDVLGEDVGDAEDFINKIIGWIDVSPCAK